MSNASRLEALLELAALQAVHGVDAVSLSDDNAQQLLDLAGSGALEEDAAANQLGEKHINVVLRCRACTTSAGDGPSTHGPPHGSQEKADGVVVVIELSLSLPPGYPSGTGDSLPPPQPCQSGRQPPLQPVPVPAPPQQQQQQEPLLPPGVAADWPTAVRLGGLSVAGAGVACAGRDWCDGLLSELTMLARQAAVEARPYLHDLWERLQSAAEDREAERQQERGQQRHAAAWAAPCSPTGVAVAAGASSSNDVGGDGGNELQVLLLRLDHMHNRALYGKTIGSWIRELRLTGRLIFQGNLILILLEGDADSLREYLVRHRTENVDVDSRGRKCKERMMGVIVQQPQSTKRQEQHQQGVNPMQQAGGRERRGVAGNRARVFPDYREVQLETLEQVGELLRQAGIGNYLRLAAGLPRARG